MSIYCTQGFALGNLNSLFFSSLILCSISANSTFPRIYSILNDQECNLRQSCNALSNFAFMGASTSSFWFWLHQSGHCFFSPVYQFLASSGLGCLKLVEYVNHSLQLYVPAQLLKQIFHQHVFYCIRSKNVFTNFIKTKLLHNKSNASQKPYLHMKSQNNLEGTILWFTVNHSQSFSIRWLIKCDGLGNSTT